MVGNTYKQELIQRINSITTKTLVWTCTLYIFYIFHAPQSDYISSQVSETVVYCFIYVLTTLFGLMGLYITIVILFGNDNDMENIYRFVLDNYVAIMVAILIVKR